MCVERKAPLSKCFYIYLSCLSESKREDTHSFTCFSLSSSSLLRSSLIFLLLLVHALSLSLLSHLSFLSVLATSQCTFLLVLTTFYLYNNQRLYCVFLELSIIWFHRFMHLLFFLCSSNSTRAVKNNTLYFCTYRILLYFGTYRSFWRCFQLCFCSLVFIFVLTKSFHLVSLSFIFIFVLAKLFLYVVFIFVLAESFKTWVGLRSFLFLYLQNLYFLTSISFATHLFLYLHNLYFFNIHFFCHSFIFVLTQPSYVKFLFFRNKHFWDSHHLSHVVVSTWFSFFRPSHLVVSHLIKIQCFFNISKLNCNWSRSLLKPIRKPLELSYDDITALFNQNIDHR